MWTLGMSDVEMGTLMFQSVLVEIDDLFDSWGGMITSLLERNYKVTKKKKKKQN